MLGLAMTPYGWLDAWGDPKGQSATTINGLKQGMGAWAGDAAEHPAAAAGAGVVGLGLGLGGPEMLGTKASRAAEFAEGATKLGGGTVAGDVARWLERGARQDHIDDLAAKFDQTFAEYMTTREVADPGKPFEDPAFRDMWDGAVEDYRQTHPGFRFLEDGGLKHAEDNGGHAIDRHVKEQARGPALDEKLWDRFKGKKPHGVFTVPLADVDAAVAKTLDARAPQIQKWLDDVASGNGVQLTEGFEAPSGSFIGRGYEPKLPEPYYDAQSTRVVLRVDSSSPAGYRIVTAYPRP